MARLASNRTPPLIEVGLRVVKNDKFLAQRHQNRRKLFEPIRNLLECFPLVLQLLWIVTGRLVRQLLALCNGSAQCVPDRSSQVLCGLASVVGFLNDSVDLVYGSHVVIERDCIADKPAGVCQRRLRRCSWARDRLLRGDLRAHDLGNRSLQLRDRSLQPGSDLAIVLDKRRHFLNRVQQRLLQIQFALQRFAL